MKLISKLFAYFRPRAKGRYAGRQRTFDDTSITYRMQSGFQGTVTRTHPVSIEPVLFDPTNPPTDYGQPVVVDGTSGLPRKLLNTDNAADAIYGIVVRPFPTQQFKDSVGFGVTSLGGAVAPQQGQSGDVCRSGYIMSKLNVAGPVKKGGRVFIWAVATNGSHILGGFEPSASAGNTIELDEKSYYNGPEDANLFVEIGFNI